MPEKNDTVVDRPTPADPGRHECLQAARHKSPLLSGFRFSNTGGITACLRAASVAVVSLVLLACLGKASAPHIGQTARPDNRMPLAGLPEGEATWVAKDLKLHYRARTAGDNLNISGFVEFSSNLAKYPLINRFRVNTHFLNAEGVVLDTKLLWATGVKLETSFVRWTFERKWPLPPGSVALAFSYRGAASEAGGKGHQAKTGWEVYQAP